LTAFFPSEGDSPEKFKSFVSAIEGHFSAASVYVVPIWF